MEANRSQNLGDRFSTEWQITWTLNRYMYEKSVPTLLMMCFRLHRAPVIASTCHHIPVPRTPCHHLYQIHWLAVFVSGTDEDNDAWSPQKHHGRDSKCGKAVLSWLSREYNCIFQTSGRQRFLLCLQLRLTEFTDAMWFFILKRQRVWL